MMKKIFLILILMVSIVIADEVTLGTLGKIVVDSNGHIIHFTARGGDDDQDYDNDNGQYYGIIMAKTVK